MAVVGIPKAQLTARQQQRQNYLAKNPNANGNVNPRPVTQNPAPGPNPNGVGAQQPVQNYASNPQYKQLNTQRQQVLDEIHRRGGIAKTPGFATKLNDLNTQIRGMRNGVPGTGGGVTVENGAPPPPAADPAAPPAPATPDTSAADAAKALYPSLNYQLPENYQGSPMYKFQMQQGTQALNRKLAQRGLLDSGAELEATNKLSSEVGAQESQRLMDQAQTEADRYERVSSNEANRGILQENNQWNRLMDVFNAMNKQSPMQQAYDGLNTSSSINMKRGQNKANNTANNYKRVSAGGGQSMPGFVPPQPSGPDYSQSNMMKLLFGNSNSRQNSSVIDSLIGSLFG